MGIYEFEGRRPSIHPEAWIAPSADIIGDVRIGARCYIGWGAILRGDHGTIIVEEGSAVEEGVVIHTTVGFLTRVGREVTIGHGAMLHNATVDDFAVIGVCATVSNFARIGRWSIVGEMGLVLAKQDIPPEVIVVGVPGQVIGRVEEHHKMRWMEGKKRYQAFTRRNPSGLKPITREECGFHAEPA
jgi:carbonic anhydrase/acetyltransferase-like protein (isoleucine patch superfamily)